MVNCDRLITKQVDCFNPMAKMRTQEKQRVKILFVLSQIVTRVNFTQKEFWNNHNSN